MGAALLLAPLGEPHAHLDKVLTADVAPNLSGDLLGAIDAWVLAAQKGLFSFDDMVHRAERALTALLFSGVTAVRSHINIGTEVGIVHLLAVQQAAANFRSVMDIQLVALMHSPVTGREGAGNRAMLTQAIDAGVDLVGGCPHLDDDPVQAVKVLFDAAEQAGLDIDLHTDETLNPESLSLVTMAHTIQERGFARRVAASHCVSLCMQTEQRQVEIAQEVAAAGIAVIPQPQTNLYLQGRGFPTAMPRSLAPISTLRRAGVLVAAGGDNVQDPFNPVGRSDPLETAALLILAGHQLPHDAYDMVSRNVREVMGLAPAGLEVGDQADFIAIQATSVREAIADACHSRKVYHRGRLVASSETTRAMFHSLPTSQY